MNQDQQMELDFGVTVTRSKGEAVIKGTEDNINSFLAALCETTQRLRVGHGVKIVESNIEKVAEDSYIANIRFDSNENVTEALFASQYGHGIVPMVTMKSATEIYSVAVDLIAENIEEKTKTVASIINGFVLKLSTNA